jgi:poly-beta-1,6-N-acetyl-D-glucosamine synthase
MFFWIIYISALVLYFILILSFSVGWMRLKEFHASKTPTKDYTQFSVLVAIRNEAQNAENLVSCLLKQNYPYEKFEVFLIDDHSQDSTAEIFTNLVKDFKNFQVLSLPENENGKKAALKYGTIHSSGEVCVFTDADCNFSPNWINSLNEFYILQNKPDLIIGLVDCIANGNFLQKIFRLEFLSLILSSAGAASLGYPVFCSGANLAVKRHDYLSASNLKSSIASGDDVFLLHELKAQKKNIKILKSKEHLVITRPPESIAGFFNQRIRWGKKSRHYTDKATLSLALLIVFVNFLLLAGCFLSLIHKTMPFFLIGLALKVVSDTTLFYSGNSFFKLNKYLLLLPVMELFYPFYILFIVLIPQKRPFKWKGRQIH